MNPNLTPIEQIRQCLTLAEACFGADASAAAEQAAILLGRAKQQLDYLRSDIREGVTGEDDFLDLALAENKGALCREWRERVGWTQNDLSSAAQISQSTISKFESGSLSISLENFAKLLLALKGREAILRSEQASEP